MPATPARSTSVDLTPCPQSPATKSRTWRALARLDLSDDELSHYAEQLDVIPRRHTRGEVAAQDVEPMSHPVMLDNVFAPMSCNQDSPAEEALSAAPAVEDSCFRVPRILDEE